MIIEAYAVVSADDRITDATGGMPDALRTDAEWAFFQAGLDSAEVTVLGRLSHEVTPNPKARRRLVMTRSVPGLRRDGERTVFWNPDEAPLAQALAAFGAAIGHLAVAGGQGVFDHFLTGPARYTAFHLSRIDSVTLPGGTAVFSAAQDGATRAEHILRRHGYSPGPRRQLDRLAHVITWTPG